MIFRPEINDIPLRTCDSHTLNVSPLCNLATTVKPMKWAKEVLDLYDEKNPPEYVKSKVSPVRNKYLTNKMKQNEIFTSLTKVQGYDF